MHHHSFVFDGVFHEDTGNNVVFAKAVAEMIPLACDGKVATVMAYGQVSPCCSLSLRQSLAGCSTRCRFTPEPWLLDGGAVASVTVAPHSSALMPGRRRVPERPSP